MKLLACLILSGVFGVPWGSSSEDISKLHQIEYSMGPNIMIQHGVLAGYPFVVKYRLKDDKLVGGTLIVPHVGENKDVVCEKSFMFLKETFGKATYVEEEWAAWNNQDRMMILMCNEKLGAELVIVPNKVAPTKVPVKI